MLFLTIVDIFYSFGVVCLVCEIGQQISMTYDDIDGIIGQFDWYLFPCGIQRIFPIILMNSQETVILPCFGSISCDRDVSKKVGSLAKEIPHDLWPLSVFLFMVDIEFKFFRCFIKDTHISWLFANS